MTRAANIDYHWGGGGDLAACDVELAMVSPEYSAFCIHLASEEFAYENDDKQNSVSS